MTPPIQNPRMQGQALKPPPRTEEPHRGPIADRLRNFQQNLKPTTPRPMPFYPLTDVLFVLYDVTSRRRNKKGRKKMPKLTLEVAEEALRTVVQLLDKRVQLMAVNQTKKKDAYRVTLLKAGKTGSAKIKEDLIKEYLSEEGKGNELRKALGKAVSHLSIRYK